MQFLDTNVLLRYFTRDVERGKERVEMSLPVIFETIFTLQQYYRVPLPQIKDLLLPILRMRRLRFPSKSVYSGQMANEVMTKRIELPLLIYGYLVSPLSAD
jgi:hypothetical protein